MHKNVNLNQFSIIHDQKKIIGKDDPSNVQCTMYIHTFSFFQTEETTAAVTTTLVAKVSKTSPTSGNKSHTVKEEEMEENDGKSKGSMKKVAWLILIVIGIVAIFTGVGVKIFLVIRVVIGGVHHKEHVSFK